MSEQKEGTWRVTQGNGREYLVHTAAKARIATNCGYTVERIDDVPVEERAAQICEQVAAQSNNSLFRSGAKICAGEIRRAAEEGLAPTFGIPLYEDMRRALEHVECVYRTNVVKDCEPSSTLDNLQRVIARIHSEPSPAVRIAELERERDHWKANHDAQVERARVLMERPDMPLERVRAYQHMRTLQRLVDVQKMLLEAFTGQLAAPADFNPCTDDPIPGLDASVQRLRDAYCVQQPLPVPDQMALVYRVDIGRLRADWVHKRAYFESTVPAMQKIRAAIQDYHFALDSRAHGGIAQNRAFNAICEALGMHWEQGKELQRRAKAASGESNQPSEQGKA